MMLQVSAADVKADPYPHVIKDGLLPEEMFRRLKADFPGSSVFEGTASATGSTGSRAGKGSGFDIYRGDSAYDDLIARSEAWAEFDAWINSRAFVDKYQELFGPHAEAIDISVDIPGSTYDRDFVEPREVLTENATIADKIGGLTHKLTRGFGGLRKIDLFTRLDITRSLGGYAKPPHTDRPNRLCSLILYFVNAEETGLEGGGLLIYQLKQPKKTSDAPRHPREDEVEIIAELKPKENLGVFFPCCNTSYHGVTAITSQGVPRDFLYINISGRTGNLW